MSVFGSPHNARLVSWGRARDGWWGCIVWDQRVVRGVEPTVLPVAAWIPAQRLSKPGWASTETVPRTTLTPLRHEWPPPDGFQGWYAGAWIDGPIRLPPGVDIVTGPAWRRR